MSGIVNKTGAVSGIIGTTVGTPAHTETNAANVGSGVLPVGVTGGSGLTALGTVATGNLSNVNIIMPRYKEISSYYYATVTTTSTTGQNSINISGTNYVTLTPEATGDIAEFGWAFNGYGSDDYSGIGIERATNTTFTTNKTTIWSIGQHGDEWDETVNYRNMGGSKVQDFNGLSAGTTYYFRMHGMTHTGAGSWTWGAPTTSAVLPGVHMTGKRWSIT